MRLGINTEKLRLYRQPSELLYALRCSRYRRLICPARGTITSLPLRKMASRLGAHTMWKTSSALDNSNDPGQTNNRACSPCRNLLVMHVSTRTQVCSSVMRLLLKQLLYHAIIQPKLRKFCTWGTGSHLVLVWYIALLVQGINVRYLRLISTH
jgi:hypothetical protein